MACQRVKERNAMKKFIVFMFALLLLSTIFIAPAAATVDDYNPSVLGRVTATVDVPNGFNEIVYLCLMDTMGGESSYAILPEGNYTLVENIPCGVYFVSAYVDNDIMMEYIVRRNANNITVSRDQDTFIALTVSGGPEGEAPEEKELENLPVESIPETTPATNTTLPETSSNPTTTAPSEVDQTGEQGDPAALTEQTIPGAQDDEVSSFWQDVLVSLVVSAGFIGLIFGIVYLYRRFSDRF